MKRLNEQGTIADIPLHTMSKLYYVRSENDESVDEGWITVDEARRVNSSDRRMFGSPQNRYFQDKQSADAFSQSQAPMDNMDMGAPPDDFGAGMEEPMPDEGMPEEEPMDDMGMGDDLGGDIDFDASEFEGDDFGGDEMDFEPEGEPDDLLGDLGGDEDFSDLGDTSDDLLGDADEEDGVLELRVPRKLRLVPESMQEKIPTFHGEPRMSFDPDTGGEEDMAQPKGQLFPRLDQLVQEATGFTINDLYDELDPDDADFMMELIDEAGERGDSPYKAFSILKDLDAFKQLVQEPDEPEGEPWSEAPAGSVNPAAYQMDVSQVLMTQPEGPQITRKMMNDPQFYEKMSEIMMDAITRGTDPEETAQRIIELYNRGGRPEWGESMDTTGLADKQGLSPEDVDPDQLAQGIEVELEHTGDQDLAQQIAMDHLAEIPDYYTRLAQMERGAGPESQETTEDGVVEALLSGDLSTSEAVEEQMED